MSRVGKKLITVPSNVTVTVKKDLLNVKGPKGELVVPYDPIIKVVNDAGKLTLSRETEDKTTRAKHGLYRALIQSAVVGVTNGYTKKLEINGVGFRAELKGHYLYMALGFSHPIYFKWPEGIKVEVPIPTNVIVSGIDKQLVGQVAAKIRGFKEPEPYKGKGIKYDTETIRRKAGKTASR